MMEDSQSAPPFSLAGPRTAAADNDEETGTPSSTDYEERAGGHPAAVLAGVRGGTTAFEHNDRGEIGSSKADSPAMLVWEGVTYR